MCENNQILKTELNNFLGFLMSKYLIREGLNFDKIVSGYTKEEYKENNPVTGDTTTEQAREKLLEVTDYHYTNNEEDSDRAR